MPGCVALLISVTGAPSSEVAPPTTNAAATTSVTPAPTAIRTPSVTVVVQLQPASATITFSAPDMATVKTRSGRSVRLPVGRTQMVVEAAGFQSSSQGIVIAAGMGPLRHRLDPDGQLHRWAWEASTGSNPKQVAFTPDGAELWVPLLGSRGVDVFRTKDGTKITTVGLGNQHGAVEVIFNRAGTRAFVSQMQTALVIEIDTATKRVLRRMTTGGNWTKVLALSPDEATIYAANWVSNDISVIDLKSGRLIKRIPTVKTPRGLALDVAGERLFVAGFDGGEIQRITLSSEDKKILFRTGGAMRHMVVDAATNRMYADDMGTNQTYVVDLATEKVSPLGRVDSHPNSIDLNPDGRFLYVSNRGANNAKGYNLPGPEWGSVLVLDTATGQPVDAIIGGNQTTGLDVSSDGRLVAFTDFLDNRLTVYIIPTAGVLDGGSGGLAPQRGRLIKK